MNFVFKCRITLASLFFFLCFTIANSQVDTSFWFAAPFQDGDYNKPIYLRVATLREASRVTISMPANSSFTNIVQDVPANSSYTFDLTPLLETIHNRNFNEVTNKGLLITGTKRISAYYEVSEPSNPDIFSLKGSNALGTDFIVLTMKNNWDNFWFQAFYVAANEDNTTITINPSVDLMGHPKSSGPFNINLNRGQVYVAVASNLSNANENPGGTIITSNKRVAVTMGGDRQGTSSGCADMNGDQMVPTNMGGNTFITLPGKLNVSGITDLVYIYPTQDNTAIYVNGTLAATKNRGQFYEILSNNNTHYITTSNPSLVYQVGGFGCEVGGAVIPQITCTGSTSVSIVRSTDESCFINILAKSGTESGFTFNGNSSIITSADFTTVPNTGGAWKWAQKTLSTSVLPMGQGAVIKNDFPFHLGLINGAAGNGTRYGYFSGFGGFSPEVTLRYNNGQAILTCHDNGLGYQWYKDNVLIPGATNQQYFTYEKGVYKVLFTYDATCPPAFSNEVKIEIGLSLNKSKIEKQYCAGAHFNVDFTANIKRKPGNTFKIQLSNGSGSFSSPVDIGTKMSTDSSGTVACILPSATPAASGYRLRMISTDTSWAGEDNGFDIAIAPLVAPALTQDTSCNIFSVSSSSLGSHIKLSGGPSSSTTAGYLTVPNTISTANNFTFETWINLKSYDDWANILDFGNDFSDVNFFLTTSTGGPSNLPLFVIGDGIFSLEFLFSSAPIPLNVWTHVAVVINGTAGTGKMYIDGVEVASTSMTLTPAKLPVTMNNYIGKSKNSDPYLNAELDEIRFWNVARTPAQIIASFAKHLPAGTPNLAAYFKFDEGTGTSANNDAPTGGSATLQQGVSWVTPSQSPSGAYDRYQWSNGDTTRIIVLDTPTVFGNYTAIVTKDVGCEATSTINVKPCCTNPTQGGTISRDQYICLDMQPARIQSVSRASGETGILQYKWQKSIVEDTLGFEDIPGATDSTYQPPVLNQTTWYRRQAKVDCKEDWSGAANSNAVKMTVVPDTDRYLIIESLVQPTCNPPEGCTLTIRGLPMATWTLEQMGPVDGTLTGMDNPFILEDLPDGVYKFRTADANGCIESPPFGVIVVTY